MTYFLGMDPGSASGAWAILMEDGSYFSSGLFEPPLAHLGNIIEVYAEKLIVACVEKVSSMPKQGVASSFAFGKSAGYLEGFLDAHRISYSLITPQRWQELVDTKPANEPSVSGESAAEKAKRLAGNRSRRKEAIVAAAIRRWPEAAEVLSKKKNSGIADALFLALYAKKNNI